MMVDVPLSGSSVPYAERAFVGRDAELASLAGLLGVVPQPGLPVETAVLLGGDAGVGKTRLLTELRDLAFAEGWQVVAGHCLDFGDSALPYLPFSEILGRLVSHAPELVEAVTEQRPALSRLRPGRRLLSESELTEGGALERGDLFDAVHALLEEGAQPAPLLLVVEDVHWADRSTREMLSYLFSRPYTSRVAIVASYRSDDLHRRHPLRRAAAEWARVPGVGRMQLNPLKPPDVRTLVRTLHPLPMPEADVARIVDRAEGNAFFVEELVGAAALAGRGIPDDLAELLLVRLDHLSETAQQVVRAASVSGRRVGHDLLAATAGVFEPDLEPALRDAVERNVLVPARGDAYAFRHALLAEAVYDDLLPGERARFHAAFARALDEGRAVGTAAELARHARAAHDLPTAVTASIRAGDEAMSVGGPDEAARHYESALELLADPALLRVLAIDVASLGARTAEALVASGDPPRALALGRRLLSELPDDAPPEWRGRLLASMAATVMVAETTLDPLEVTVQALQLVPEEPSALRARLLHLHARALLNAEQHDEARAEALEALSMAETLDLPRLASDVMATLATIDSDEGNDVRATLEQVAALAASTGATTAELRALWLLGRWHWDRAEFVEAGEAFQRAVHRGEEVGLPWAPYAFDARISALMVAVVRGDWDAALALAEVTDQAPPPIPEAVLAAGRLTVQAARGEQAQIAQLPALRSTWEKDGFIAITAGPAAIELHALAGDRDAVLATHDDVVATISKLWRESFHARVRLAATTIGALAHGVEHLSAEERGRLAEPFARVFEGGQRTIQLQREVGTPWGAEGRAWANRLHAEALRFRWLTGIDPPGEAELLDAWRADLAGFEEMGHVYETARSAARLAGVLQAAGETLEARPYADAARAAARRLGAGPLLDELRGVARAATRSRATGPDEALTPREVEILALVADGRSNGEIARLLFISTKTVSVHVSNILAKLGAAGRTEAAAIARRRGLLG